MSFGKKEGSGESPFQLDLSFLNKCKKRGCRWRVRVFEVEDDWQRAGRRCCGGHGRKSIVRKV